VPVVIPEFVAYQQPLFPLRGIWRNIPAEGDRFTTAEIDWGLTTLGGTDNTAKHAVQFDVGGNSPVAMSQIAALVVDNNRCSADLTFLFPDSGFELAVPAYAGGIFPVFTNALMFYCIAPLAAPGDVTTLQIFNTLPPPVALAQSQAQAVTTAQGLPIAVATTVLIPTAISGVVEGFALDATFGGGASGGTVGLILRDQNTPVPNAIWAGTFSAPPAVTTQSDHVFLSGLKVRFQRGLVATMTLTGTPAGGALNVNVYYSVP
jgi:hypothetical protein